MHESLPLIYLARHGETAWSVSGQHTSLTDLPLTARGKENARRLAGRLADVGFSLVLTSPLQRARRTCELAGFGAAVTDPDLLEWNYGAYEGKTPAEIRRARPGWEIFRDGCPEGESLAQVAARADRVAARLRAAGGSVLFLERASVARARGALARARRISGPVSLPRYGGALHPGVPAGARGAGDQTLERLPPRLRLRVRCVMGFRSKAGQCDLRS